MSKRRKRDHASQPGNGGDVAQFEGVNNDFPTPAATHERAGRTESISGDEDDAPVRSTQRRATTQAIPTSRQRSKQQQLDFDNARDPGSFSSPFKLPPSSAPRSSGRAGIFGTQSRVKRRRTVQISSDENESHSVDEGLESPRRLLSKARHRPLAEGDADEQPTRTTRASQRAIVIESDDEVSDAGPATEADLLNQDDALESDDGEDMPTTIGKQSRRRERRASRDSFISSSPPRAIHSDSDEVESVEKPKKRRLASPESEEDDEDEDVSATPSRRRLKSRKISQQDQEELDEDLEFLGPSSDVEHLPSNTQSRKKDARLQALEKLKRKRAGQLQTVAEDGEEEVDDAQEESDSFQSGYDVTDDEEQAPLPTSSRQMFNADDEDEAFIDSDEEEGVLGHPDTGVPIQFTKFARMKAKELFKFAVEWMVQKKINPAFKAQDELYDLAFKKLDDEVKGLAGSKFESSVWRQEFAFALWARPDFASQEIDRQSDPESLFNHCEACNRKSHPATFEIQFQGKPYHPSTLEEVDQPDDDDDGEDASSSGSDDSDDDANDKPAVDHQGREVVPATKTFRVGKFCMANAQTAHALRHWRYHLNAWVVSWLVRNGYDTPAKIVERDRWKMKKRRKYANKIADRMEKEGATKELYREFRNNIDEARNSKQGRFERSSP